MRNRIILKCITIFLIFTVLYIFLHGIIKNKLIHVENDVKDWNFHKQACIQPALDPYDPVMMKSYKHLQTPTCSSKPDLVHIKNGFIILDNSYYKYQNLTCHVKFMRRKSDFETDYTKPKQIDAQIRQIKLETDFFKVMCKSQNIIVYDNIHCGVAKQNISITNKTVLGSLSDVNILIIGFDSMSQNAFQRLLPKSYKYFTEILNGQVLAGYNIVGDGTQQALIPILTGKTEQELPSVLRRIEESHNVDIFPIIWKKFKKAGYVTAFAEDSCDLGTFTFRMNGFKEQPTHHYMRTFYLVAKKEFFKHPKLCFGSKRRAKLFLDWLIDIFETYKNNRKFVFGFHSELSHSNNNPIQTADEDILSTLKYLHDSLFLTDTILILMSDHGARFSDVRSTLQGKQEERKPFVGMYIPEKIRVNYPNAWQNLKTNVKKLSTPFDIYETFEHILNFKNFNDTKKIKRGISLFSKIPSERTCMQAAIEPHWCNCLKWEQGQTDTPESYKIANVVVKHINSLTDIVRGKCHLLSLKKILKFQTLLPFQQMLHFKRSKDLDGYEPDLTDNTEVSIKIHQVEFIVSPNNAVYEATVNVNNRNKQLQVKTEDISRLNEYGQTAKCVEEKHEELRKFCFCHDLHNVIKRI